VFGQSWRSALTIDLLFNPSKRAASLCTCLESTRGMGNNVSNFFTPEFNNESAIAPWNGSLEAAQGIIRKLDPNGSLTGGVGQEVNIPTLTPESYDNIILPDALPTSIASVATTDSNTSLPDSSVDLLTGQAMSEVYEDLSKFAAGSDFVTEMNLAFGENWDAAGAKALAEGWFNGDFSAIPSVKVVSSAEIGGANGAFAAATDTIYLSKEFLTQNGANPAAVADVLLEEIGHSVDSLLNVTDSPGDEGAIFAAVVQGKELSQGEIQALKSEDDTATVLLDGHQYLVEKQLNDGNDTLNTAQNLGNGPWFGENTAVQSTNKVGSIGGSDLNDYYKFSLVDTRQVNVTLNGLQADADLQLLDRNGNQIQSSTNSGASAESITRTLNAGEYFIRVYPYLNASTNYQVNLTLTTLQTQVPANNWKAEYFNNRDLTGNPVFVENLGNGSQGFSRNWGTAAPNNNTPPDNFSARMTTQRSLAPGLYQIKVQADDGVKVKVGNQSVIDRWFDQPFATNSGYFRSNGGTVPITVDYYERGGSAALNFSITPATKFRDSVDYTREWKATVYSWNSSQGSAPPTNFWEGDINSPNAIGEINLGSNTRSDGKKGINVNWGQGAPNGDGNRLPHDFFAMRAFTQADFDGSPYKFRVQGDDGFQLLAKNQSTGQWFNITSANQWTQSYSPTEITYQLPAGRYDMHFHQYEGGGDARFDLSWDKVSSQPPLFSNPTRSNPLRGFVHPLGQSVTTPITWNHSSSYGQENAVDLFANFGTQVYAMRSGTVVGWNDSTPDRDRNLRVIDDGKLGTTANYLLVKLDDTDGVDDGYRAMYLHLQQGSIPSKFKQIGARVGANELIGNVGYNGVSQGVHLHVELNKPTGSPTNMWQRQTYPFQWK
jgi:murein DD-endopeptidase MepM/ murein hydrolase activator NlpD